MVLNGCWSLELVDLWSLTVSGAKWSYKAVGLWSWMVSELVRLWSWSLEQCFAMCGWLAFWWCCWVLFFGEVLCCSLVFLRWVVMRWGVVVLWCCLVLGWLFKLVLGGSLALVQCNV